MHPVFPGGGEGGVVAVPVLHPLPPQLAQYRRVERIVAVAVVQILERPVPEQAVLVLHLEDGQGRIVLVGQARVGIDVGEEGLEVLPARVLQLGHEVDHAAGVLTLQASARIVAQLVVQVGGVAVVRRNDVRIEDDPVHVDAAVLQDREPAVEYVEAVRVDVALARARVLQQHAQQPFDGVQAHQVQPVLGVVVRLAPHPFIGGLY